MALILPGKETCNECEPGLLQVHQPGLYSDLPPKATSESARKKEMKELRKKYGLAGNPPPDSEKNGGSGVDSASRGGYVDRAGKRRREVGSDNPNEKTEVADVTTNIRSDNKGFKMLAGMGWKEGEGLGKPEAQGRVEPVQVRVLKKKLTALTPIPFVRFMSFNRLSIITIVFKLPPYIF